MTGSAAAGALPHIARVVGDAADRATVAADRAAALADQVRGDAASLRHALGGGPPRQIREAHTQASASATALDETAAALRDAVDALRAYSTRLG